MLRKILLIALLIALLVYLLVCGLLVAMETQMVYPAPKFPRGNWEPNFEHTSIDFEARDGTKLHAWLIPAADEGRRNFLLCHGNGENVASSSAWMGALLAKEFDANVFVFDYRGYGKSEGSPNEAGLRMDGERAMEVFCEKIGKKPSDIIVIGHSVGGGVATHIAAETPCKALILQRTFDRMVDVAAGQYWWAPVRLLMRNPFDSASALAQYDGPVLQSHGESDRLIPIKHGRALFENTTHPQSQFLSQPNVGHNDAFPPEYWGQLEEWLRKIEQ